MQANLTRSAPRTTWLVIVGTLMLAGRAMTLAFITRAGGTGVGDPPDAWLMPLIGDAVIGLAALGVAYLLWKRPSPATWIVAIVWNALGAFDALAALLIHISNPWDEFFMIKIFGPSMFVIAAAMHVGLIVLLGRREVHQHMSVDW